MELHQLHQLNHPLAGGAGGGSLEVGHCACSLLDRMAGRGRIFDVGSPTECNLVRTLTGDRSTPLLWAPSGLAREETPVRTDVVMTRFCEPSAAVAIFCNSEQQIQRTPGPKEAEGRRSSLTLHTDSSCSSADRSRSSTPVATSITATTSVHQWGKTETLLLLSLYVVHKEELTDKKTKKRCVWKKIAEELTRKGYCVTSLQCENRWKTLKALFRRTIDHNKKTGLLI